MLFDEAALYEVSTHQRLLAMRRGLLAAFMHQKRQTFWALLPSRIEYDLFLLRREIMQTKGILRSQGVAVADASNELPPRAELRDAIKHYRKLLRICRGNVHTYAERVEQCADDLTIQSHIHQLRFAREHARVYKAILRGFGQEVPDDPLEEQDDEYQRERPAHQRAP